MNIMARLDYLIPIGFILAMVVQVVQAFVIPLLLWKLVKAVKEQTVELTRPEEPAPVCAEQVDLFTAYQPGSYIQDAKN